MRIIFATNITWQANNVLTEVGANDRLLSYFYLVQTSPDFLQRLSEQGYPNRKEQRNVGKKTKRIPLPEQEGFTGRY